MIIEILVLVLLIVLSAFFSGSEIALFSLTNLKIRTLVKRKVKGAQALAELKSNSKRLLTTILIGNNLVNVASASLATVIATDLTGSSAIGLVTGVMTFIIVLFGELMPKNYATQNAQKISLKITPIFNILSIIFYPFIIILEFITGLLSFKKRKKSPLVTEEELKAMIDVGVEEGEVERKEREIIEKVFAFNDITTEDVMTPRIDVMALDAKLKLKKVLKTILNSPFSRIPIYEGKIDNIVGVLFVRDVLQYLAKNKKEVYLKTIAKPAYFIPESKIVNELFKEFQEKNVHMAIVVDEYGGTAGIVTLEDLLEELVGEIADESDINEHLIMRLDKNQIKVHAKTEIKEVNEFFNINLPGKPTDTISWLLLKKLKKIPKKGDKVILGNLKLEVAEASKKKIVKVLITKRNVKIEE